MKYIEESLALKMTPENEKDRAYLSEKFPHLTGESVCVAIMECLLCGERSAPAMGVHTCNERRKQQHLKRVLLG